MCTKCGENILTSMEMVMISSYSSDNLAGKGVLADMICMMLLSCMISVRTVLRSLFSSLQKMPNSLGGSPEQDSTSSTKMDSNSLRKLVRGVLLVDGVLSLSAGLFVAMLDNVGV